ncbi:MAG: hypothetical protein CBD51_002525 [Flavobacteriales bacterium TMED191]|nr:MAG: hypothetical protein CBD51_002525 [Flavobacteriales bacterium TMED191]
MRTLVLILMITFFSCAPQRKIGFNASEKSIKNEIKSYNVVGNLRVVIEPGEAKYDKAMMAAIEEYGQGIDIMNIKIDKPVLKFDNYGDGKVILNCLVIKYK